MSPDETIAQCVDLWNEDNPFGAVYDSRSRQVSWDGKLLPADDFYGPKIPEDWKVGLRSRETYYALVLKSLDLHYKYAGSRI